LTVGGSAPENSRSPRAARVCPGGNSSVGRARPCQGRGREFESRFPLQFSDMTPGNPGSCVSGARWQSGHAAACKAVYAGSIPTLASTSLCSAVSGPSCGPPRATRAIRSFPVRTVVPIAHDPHRPLPKRCRKLSPRSYRPIDESHGPKFTRPLTAVGAPRSIAFSPREHPCQNPDASVKIRMDRTGVVAPRTKSRPATPGGSKTKGRP
jgi:hypothetical protein